MRTHAICSACELLDAARTEAEMRVQSADDDCLSFGCLFINRERANSLNEHVSAAGKQCGSAMLFVAAW